MDTYPLGTTTVVRLTKIARQHESPRYQELMSTRLSGIAARLLQGQFVGWQMRVPPVGLASLEAFGSAAVGVRDLAWALDEMGWTEEGPTSAACANVAGTSDAPEVGGQGDAGQPRLLFDVDYPNPPATNTTVGFGASAPTAQGADERFASFVWPVARSVRFAELVEAMREDGCVLRWVAGPATRDERASCRERVRASWRPGSSVGVEEYLGTPFRARLLVLAPTQPSFRLVMALEQMVPGAELRALGRLGDPAADALWADPLPTADVLPDVAARISCIDPLVASDVVVGLACAEREAKPLPAEYDRPSGAGLVTLGEALWSDGLSYPVQLDPRAFTRHWQIVGQTGTGKSTLLATTVLSAIESGLGVTFLDPHGSTIDLILEHLPERLADRVRVVRIGDAAHPVPLCLWPSNDPDECERTISDLCELFANIFDPHAEGIVGPRWEHMFSTFARASIALLGKLASFEVISLAATSRDLILQIASLIEDSRPLIAEELRNLYGHNSSSEFADLMGWFLSKFERLTSQEQLRGTLGAGVNALAWSQAIDTSTVTLIDLASPAIGSHAARMVGTIILSQLWEAAMGRRCRDLTHLVVLDEAHLFQTNPLPRMLAEGRKFGLGLVLAHQSMGQLSGPVRDALAANSGHFCAFRVSVRESDDAAMRLGGGAHLAVELVRVPDFRAVTSLNVAGRQTEPFTLQTTTLDGLTACPGLRERIEHRSLQELVEPYGELRALTRDEIRHALDDRYEVNRLRRRVMGEGSELAKPSWLPNLLELDDEDIHVDDDILIDDDDLVDDDGYANDAMGAGDALAKGAPIAPPEEPPLLDGAAPVPAPSSLDEQRATVVDELPLAARTRIVLQRAGIRTLADLTSLSAAELAGLPGMDEPYVQQIRDELVARGLAPRAHDAADEGSCA